jgi:RNA polymerase sigma factor (sigma-70 family)
MSDTPPRPDNAPEPEHPLDMSAEGDGDLLAYMSMQGEFPRHAREAWAELYRRHAGYMHHVCGKLLATLPRPPTTAKDLVNDTFLRAYRKAGTYCEPSGLDQDGKRRYVRAWLSRVASRLIQDLLRAVPEGGPERQLDDEGWNEQAAPVACEKPVPPTVLAVLEEVLQNDLDEREREVLRKTYQYWVPGRAAQRLPNKVAEELAQQLGTTSENLRKIRQRAMKKVREGLERRLGPLP